jgi:hypothetical protein
LKKTLTDMKNGFFGQLDKRYQQTKDQAASVAPVVAQFGLVSPAPLGVSNAISIAANESLVVYIALGQALGDFTRVLWKGAEFNINRELARRRWKVQIDKLDFKLKVKNQKVKWEAKFSIKIIRP